MNIIKKPGLLISYGNSFIFVCLILLVIFSFFITYEESISFNSYEESKNIESGNPLHSYVIIPNRYSSNFKIGDSIPTNYPGNEDINYGIIKSIIPIDADSTKINLEYFQKNNGNVRIPIGKIEIKKEIFLANKLYNIVINSFIKKF